MAKTFEIANKKELAPLCLAIMAALEKGRMVKCEVRSVSNKSDAQLGFYYAAILPRVQQKLKQDGNEYSLAQINLFFNDLFFFTETEINGRIIKQSKSKSGATLEEMAEFLNKVIRWCGDNGIDISQPTA